MVCYRMDTTASASGGNTSRDYRAALPSDFGTAIKEIISLRIENTDLRRHNDEMREQIRIMKAREYGRSSEKLTVEDIRQGMLFDEAELHAAAPTEPEVVETVRITKTVYQRKKRGRTPLSAKLARLDVVVDLGEEERSSVPAGYELVRIGEETSEQVHEIPQKYVVIKTIRPRYIVKPMRGSGQANLDGSPRILVAPVPARILPRSIATPSLLSSVLTGKFCDALPFYRQERMFRRFGLEISRQDMANWTIAVAAKLSGYMELLKAELLRSPALHCDETYFQVMDEDERANPTKSYMWVMTGGTGRRCVVLYRYHASREGDFISSFLSSYNGFLQTDGYAGYNAIGEKPGIVHVACWAHARRKFVEAWEASFRKGSAGEAIKQIGLLYHHEKELRTQYFGEGNSGDADAFVAERRKLVVPILDELRVWLDDKSYEVPPKSALGTAIAYTLDLWPRLVRYLDSADLTPDNNEAERAIRPFTVGRKNWVLSGGPRGARASADLYSLIETFKLNALEPYYALRHILTRLPVTPADQLGTLLPWNIDPEAFHELIVEDARISLDSSSIF